MQTQRAQTERRRQRVRNALRKRGGGRARLSVFRSGRHIYAQVIDDTARRTVVAASTVEKDLRERLSSGADVAAAAEVGKIVAERAINAGVSEVVFDRGGYRYHGRVKALADAAREAGLTF
ncbi:MAG TPA: 50S ribosomal protein L18 [Alphaproteobacteria bacterium]|nr:50S ribosomal protein L18 [Alphaproteobacteria bacterium]